MQNEAERSFAQRNNQLLSPSARSDAQKKLSQTSALKQKLQQVRRDAANRSSNQGSVARGGENGAAADANGENDRRGPKFVEVGIPLDLCIRARGDAGEFSIRHGVVQGSLYEADQTGQFQQRRVMKATYCCDTVKKEFGMVNSKGLIMKSDLQNMFQVDDQIRNPVKKFEFVIERHQVPLPEDYCAPFAILNSGQVRVFWARTENQREYWVKAIRYLAGPEAGGLVGEEISELN